MRQSDDTARWAASTLNGTDLLAKNDLIDEAGGNWKYFCYVLADFDPIEADRIYNECTMEQVTQAICARSAYHKVDD